jgi:uncharacterized protein YxjI
MRTFEVTQALLTSSTVYHVRTGRRRVTHCVRGVPESRTPRFRMVVAGEGEAQDGPELALLVGNFIKTEYEIQIESRRVARLVFPAVAFKKTLTLTVGDDVYDADGGVFRGVFQCRTADGEVVLEIAKELSIRDTFSVRAKESLPPAVSVLSAVAIHSRFYDMV